MGCSTCGTSKSPQLPITLPNCKFDKPSETCSHPRFRQYTGGFHCCDCLEMFEPKKIHRSELDKSVYHDFTQVKVGGHYTQMCCQRCLVTFPMAPCPTRVSPAKKKNSISLFSKKAIFNC